MSYLCNECFLILIYPLEMKGLLLNLRILFLMGAYLWGTVIKTFRKTVLSLLRFLVLH